MPAEASNTSCERCPPFRTLYTKHAILGNLRFHLQSDIYIARTILTMSQPILAGPGCSSFDGALMEVGPIRMSEGKKGEVFEQEGSWNEYANVLFSESFRSHAGQLDGTAWRTFRLTYRLHSRSTCWYRLFVRSESQIRPQWSGSGRPYYNLSQEFLRGLP